MKEYEFEVTESDVAKAMELLASPPYLTLSMYCPVALALKRATGEQGVYARRSLARVRGRDFAYEDPGRVAYFMTWFDNDQYGERPLLPLKSRIRSLK